MPTLDWLTREEDVKRASSVPYRLLEADPELSTGDTASGNMLIQGDNLDALKSLLPYYRGRVKCIYIDPPYNTRSAFEHYDDNLEHSQWLAMMYPRLELLRELLREDGSIWVSIDDSEGHYLKAILDEVFGRRNFLGTVTWQKTTSIHNNAVLFSSASEFVLAHSRNLDFFKMGRVPRSTRNASDYSNPDNDPRGPWTSSPLHVSLTSGQRGRQYALSGQSSGLFPIVGPHGQHVLPPRGRCWAYSPETIERFEAEKRIWWGSSGRNQPRLKRFLDQTREGAVPTTLWLSSDVGHNQEAKAENASLLPELENLFATPKPERLLKRILELSTTAGDIVLDSFLGSGTTAAVALKMRRRWIGVETGQHAVTHCVPRLKKVIDGEQGGISEGANWQGGGGFTFYRLGAEVFDAAGHIRAGIGFNELAAHVWFSETGAPRLANGGPFLGIHDGKGYALLYNGILGDKRPQGGNVLTNATLATIRKAAEGFAGQITVYGEASRLGPARLKEESVTFKQTPYDVKAR